MMNDVGRLPLVQSHVQRIEHEFGAQMIDHRPTDDAPRAGVEDDRQEYVMSAT
jgi:hypothetical protein